MKRFGLSERRYDAVLSQRSVESARRNIAAKGPYRVVSRINDTYEVARRSVHCKKHEVPPKDCDDCAMTGLGVMSRIGLAADIERVLNARCKVRT